MGYRDTVKPWFETGDKPTQQQFWTLFDDLRFKDEPISQDDIIGLVTALTAKADQAALDAFTGGILYPFTTNNYFDIPAGYMMDKFIVLPSVDSDIRIGSTSGGEEYFHEQLVTAADGNPYDLSLFANTAHKRVYVFGITASTKVIVFQRKVKLL